MGPSLVRCRPKPVQLTRYLYSQLHFEEACVRFLEPSFTIIPNCITQEKTESFCGHMTVVVIREEVQFIPGASRDLGGGWAPLKFSRPVAGSHKSVAVNNWGCELDCARYSICVLYLDGETEAILSR